MKSIRLLPGKERSLQRRHPWVFAGSVARGKADAEKTFREDLAAQPGSGWALSGLSRALAAQGRAAEAQPLAPQLAQAWSAADAALTARR